MKTLRISLSLAFASLAFASFARAEDPKPEGKTAGCCAKAAADGKTCEHGCCVAAAKEGKNCEKCGGKNEKKA